MTGEYKLVKKVEPSLNTIWSEVWSNGTNMYVKTYAFGELTHFETFTDYDEAIQYLKESMSKPLLAQFEQMKVELKSTWLNNNPD